AAFAGAGLLGVIVALTSIRFRQVPLLVTESALPVQNDTQSSEDAQSTDGQIAIEPAVEAAPEKTPSRVTEASKRRANQNAAPDQNAPGAESESSSSPQLADQWQEQRPRRVRIRHQRREIDDLH